MRRSFAQLLLREDKRGVTSKLTDPTATEYGNGLCESKAAAECKTPLSSDLQEPI